MKSKLALLNLFLVLTFIAQAQIKLANIITDNMVLQRNSEVKLWGKATAGDKLVITTGWNKIKTVVKVPENGNWVANIATLEAGGPYQITVASATEKIVLHNILLGEVWLCSGQSNMDMPIRGYADQPINNANDILVDADNDNIRLFTLNYLGKKTPQDTCASKYGKWKVASAESVSEFSAVAYLYAKQLQQKLKIPVGVITSAWGGSRIESWMSKETIANFPDALSQTSNDTLKAQYHATYLYNGMIHPILNVKFKGAIWFQGEANVGHANDYPGLMQAMVANWRKDFAQGDFPFYYVQITPYFYSNSKATNAALLREAQFKAMSLIPNAGMISTIDIGEEKGIHAPEKLTVAKRLTYWAFANAYGIKGINYKSPSFKKMTIKDSVVTLDFNDVANGLYSFGKSVDGFEMAGEDKVFYPASMRTNRNNQVILKSQQVKKPVAVRYCFYNFPKTNGYLYNTAGLPLHSFRTDDWEK